MLGIVLFYFSAVHFYSAVAEGGCADMHGLMVSHGLHYFPGPDTCTLCVCDNGKPKVCKAVLCSPPLDCRSFRVGSTCCEFICLDEAFKPSEGGEASVRVVASAATSVVLLSVALLVYRVRRQKRSQPRHSDDQRSLASIGYISGSMGYVGTACEMGAAAWKPPGHYVPRGEAPPPYDEVMAQTRAEAIRLGNDSGNGFHRTYSNPVESGARQEDPLLCPGHNYVNLPRSAPQVANNQSICFNAPLLQAVPMPDTRDPNNLLAHHPLSTTVNMGFSSTIRLTGSLGTITNRGLLSLLQRETHGAPDQERPHNIPGFYTNNGALAMHSSLHRTIPRISTATNTAFDTSTPNFNRTDRSLQSEIRRSFHKPSDNRHVHNVNGRSMPRNLNLASNSEISRSIEHNLAQAENSMPSVEVEAVIGPRANCEEQDAGDGGRRPSNETLRKLAKLFNSLPPETAAAAPQSTLPLTVDKPSCVCSYEATEPAAGEDVDDYRSECENCKSANGSRWVLEAGWEEEADDGGTQTLQRRAPPTAPPPPATATLPQPVTKQRTLGPPSNWENWFNTIPDSSSSEDE